MNNIPEIKLDITTEKIKARPVALQHTANINPETGIRYGVIQNNSLDGDAFF